MFLCGLTVVFTGWLFTYYNLKLMTLLLAFKLANNNSCIFHYLEYDNQCGIHLIAQWLAQMPLMII